MKYFNRIVESIRGIRRGVQAHADQAFFGACETKDQEIEEIRPELDYQPGEGEKVLEVRLDDETIRKFVLHRREAGKLENPK